MTKIKSATPLLMALLGIGVCLTGHAALQAEQGAPMQPAPPQATDANPFEKDAARTDAKKTAEVASIGLVHDFGKIPRYEVAKHTFCIVNTTGVPLRVLGPRVS